MTSIDSAILISYFVGVMVVGLWFGRGERNTGDYFLGGRSQHWLLAGISIIATEISALTYVGVPADSFRGDWYYLQMYFGSFVGRILIVFVLLPVFYGGAVTTVYEYLGQRFGPCTRTTAAAMFLVSRVIGSAFRLLAGSLALSEVFQWSLPVVLVATATITIAYSSFGGIKSIMWTDVFQAALFLGGAVCVIVFVLHSLSGSWTDSLRHAWDSGKFHTFHWDSNFNSSKAFWVLFIHSVIQTMAALGCDQDMTQRMLTCRNLRQGQKSLVFNALMGFPIVMLFLSVGVALWMYYAHHSASSPVNVLGASDRLFPHFIHTELPPGLRGLLVTAIFATTMSSLASAVGALSTSAVTDFLRPLHRFLNPGEALVERKAMLAARGLSIAFGIVLIVVALGFQGKDKILWETFQWASLFFGAMLGVFLLGALTRNRGRDKCNCAVMILGFSILLGIKWAQSAADQVWIAWPWWVVLGTAWTFTASAIFPTRKRAV